MDDKHQPEPTECSWSEAVQPVARDYFDSVFKSQLARGKEKYGADLNDARREIRRLRGEIAALAAAGLVEEGK